METPGIYIIGEFLGYESKPWKTDSSRFNHRIGVKTGTITRSFGQDDDLVQTIDLYDEHQINYFSAEAEKLKGKKISLVISFSVKTGPKGPWLSKYVPKGYLPNLISEPSTLRKAG